MVSETASQSKKSSSMMQRIGGEHMLDFVVSVFVGRIQADSELNHFFDTYETHDLVTFQKNVLTTALSEHPKGFDMNAFMLLRYYSLIERGFKADHFNLIVRHFEYSLEDAWVREDVVQEAIEKLSGLGIIFQNTEDKNPSSRRSVDREKRVTARSSSGEGLLRMIGLKGPKRTKQ